MPAMAQVRTGKHTRSHVGVAMHAISFRLISFLPSDFYTIVASDELDP